VSVRANELLDVHASDEVIAENVDMKDTSFTDWRAVDATHHLMDLDGDAAIRTRGEGDRLHERSPSSWRGTR
jgi:hypothetical protein